MTERNRLGRGGVRARTTILASVVVAVALLIASATLLWLLRDRLVGVEISAASLRSRDLAALATDGELPEDLSFPGDDEGFSQVVTADGEIIASTRNVRDEPAVSSLRPPAGDSRFEIQGDLPVGDDARFAISARSVDTEDNGTVTVLAGSSLAAADETWRSVLIFLLIGSPLLVVLVALVTLRVVGRSLAPVESIRRRVSEITEDELDKRVPEPGTGDEIDRLATSMNSMLERLEQSSDRQRRFVADASHELRSPLASARTTLEVAVAHPSSLATLLTAIDDALIDQRRLESLVADLLTLARLDDRSPTHTQRPIDLTRTVTAFAAERADQRIHLLPDMSGASPVWCLTDPTHLHRVLTNLVDNALAHCTSAVQLSVSTESDRAILLIDDDGPGIPDEQRERVFERFVRLDQARTAERGTGLGLAIVRDLLRADGATVRVTESPLGGARLEVRLSRCDATVG